MGKLQLIVEGFGEVQAAPTLVRNTLFANGIYDCEVLRPHRRCCLPALESNNWTNFDRFLETAFIEGASVLWMLDCDDGCPIDWISKIYDHLNGAYLKQPLAIVLWVREFEVLFLYDWQKLVESLGALPCETVANPEAIRGVKGFIDRHLPNGIIYKETTHQNSITAMLDINQLRSNRSFQHFERALLWLVNQDAPRLY